MTTRLWTKKEVNKIVQSLESIASEHMLPVDVKKDPEFISVTLKGENVFRALKTNGPWLVTFNSKYISEVPA